MADQARRYTILGFGEEYRAPIEKKGRPSQGTPHVRSLAEAQTMLAPRISSVVTAVRSLPNEQRLDEVVIELRLNEKFLAKSYNPGELLRVAGLTPRGTGSWLPPSTGEPSGKAPPEVAGRLEAKPSRALFVSGRMDALQNLQTAIVRGGASPKVDEDIRKLEDIRLPVPEDRLRQGLQEARSTRAVELVLYAWDEQRCKQAIERIRSLLAAHGISGSSRVRIKSYHKGPTFIAALVPPELIAQFGRLNFLRAARPLPRIQFTRTAVRHAMSAAPVPLRIPAPAARIAIFDGGYAQGHSLLDPYVITHDLTTKPAAPELVDHGTMVASAAVYGPIDPTAGLPPPACRVLSYRVLPDPASDELELYGVIDSIEQQVPKLKDVHVINLSFGPPGPIDDTPSRFTYAIDRLSREHGKLFVIAVGNDGHIPGLERIQAPADSVNNLAVGAYRLGSTGIPEPAHYSSRGPGRSGNTLKPDLLAFGGCPARPFHVLVSQPGLVAPETGTSFAAPMTSAVAGQLHALVDPARLQPEALRALLIHTVSPMEPSRSEFVGHGRIADSLEQVLACSPTRVSVLYQGVVSPRDGWKLPFLLPPDFEAGGMVRFEWTIVLSPDVDFASPDEYTLVGIEFAFRPHSDIFTFNPPKGSMEKPVKLNILTEAKQCQELEDKGWKRSLLPVSDSKPGKNEHVLRSAEGKWETVVRDSRRKQPTHLSEPMLTLSVVGRGAWDRKDPSLQSRYAAILTVDAPKYKGDLYGQVLRTFDRLRPLRLRQQLQVR